MRRKRIDADEVSARVSRTGLETLLTRGEAAALIAAHLVDPDSTIKQLRNRVVMRLERSVGTPDDVKIGKIPRQADGRFLAGDVIRWARVIAYGLPLPEFPPTNRRIDDFAESGGVASSGIVHDDLPRTIDGAHEVIRTLDQEIAQLKKAAANWDSDRRAKVVAPLHKNRRRTASRIPEIEAPECRQAREPDSTGGH